MENLEKLKKAFSEALNMPPEQVTDALAYNSAKNWDSLGHMALVAAIENAFGIMMSTDEVIDLSTFTKAKIILEQHGVRFA